MGGNIRSELLQTYVQLIVRYFVALKDRFMSAPECMRLSREFRTRSLTSSWMVLLIFHMRATFRSSSPISRKYEWKLSRKAQYSTISMYTDGNNNNSNSEGGEGEKPPGPWDPCDYYSTEQWSRKPVNILLEPLLLGSIQTCESLQRRYRNSLECTNNSAPRTITESNATAYSPFAYNWYLLWRHRRSVHNSCRGWNL